MTIIKNYEISELAIMSTNKNLGDIMKQSFEFWHKMYTYSPINSPLVWRKALKVDSEIIKKIDMLKNNSDKNIEIIIEQFFEMWSNAIRKSNFELAKKSMQYWEEFWKNTTNEQFMICNEILQMIERYWKEIQIKNIE